MCIHMQELQIKITYVKYNMFPPLALTEIPLYQPGKTKFEFRTLRILSFLYQS